MRCNAHIHFDEGDPIILEHITETEGVEPYARLSVGFGSATLFMSPEQIAELHRLTGEYLEARKAEDVAVFNEAEALPEIEQWEGDGGKAAEVTKKTGCQMTHDQEFENFVGPVDHDPTELCNRCHDYPCHCTADAMDAEVANG